MPHQTRDAIVCYRKERGRQAEDALLTLISDLSRQTGWCRASERFMADTLACSDRHVRRVLRRLHEQRLVAIHHERGRRLLIKPTGFARPEEATDAPPAPPPAPATAPVDNLAHAPATPDIEVRRPRTLRSDPVRTSGSARYISDKREFRGSAADPLKRAGKNQPQPGRVGGRDHSVSGGSAREQHHHRRPPRRANAEEGGALFDERGRPARAYFNPWRPRPRETGAYDERPPEQRLTEAFKAGEVMFCDYGGQQRLIAGIAYGRHGPDLSYHLFLTLERTDGEGTERVPVPITAMARAGDGAGRIRFWR